MRQHAPDPYARRRAYWPVLRRFARWAVWSCRALAALGLLNRDGSAARWLSREVGRLEHFLRCMLVIACQTRRGASLIPPGLSSRFGGEAGEAGTHASNLTKSDCDKRAADATPPAGGGRSPAPVFSLTLAAFGHKAPPPDIGRRHMTPTPERPALAPAKRLAARIDAVIAAMENIELHADRMARRIARLGLMLRRAATRRPAGASATHKPATLAPAPTSDAAILDTS